MTNINEGNNGFHLFTVVTDGYGNLIAEDTKGRELARVSIERNVDGERDDDPTDAPFVKLTRLVFRVLEGDVEPNDPSANEGGQPVRITER